MSEESFGWTSVESFDTKMSEDDITFMNKLDVTQIKNGHRKKSKVNSHCGDVDEVDGVEVKCEEKNSNKNLVKLEAIDCEENEGTLKKKRKRKMGPPASDEPELEGKKFKKKFHEEIEIRSYEVENISQQVHSICSVSDDAVIHVNKKIKKQKIKNTKKLENGYEDTKSFEDLTPTVKVKKERKSKKDCAMQQESIAFTANQMFDDIGEIRDDGTHNKSLKKKKHKSKDKTLENETNSMPCDTREAKSKKVKKENADLPEKNYKYEEPDYSQNPIQRINSSTIRKSNTMPGVDSRDSSPISETKTRKLIRKTSFHYESPNDDITTRQDETSSPVGEFTTRKSIGKNTLHYKSPDEDELTKKGLSNRSNEKHNTIFSSSDEGDVQMSEAPLHKGNDDGASENQCLNNGGENSRPISITRSPILVNNNKEQQKVRSNSLIDTSDSSDGDIQHSLRNENSQIGSKKTKTSSISDKIRFESEISDDGPEFPRGNEKLKKVLDNYVNLKRVGTSFFKQTSVCPETDDIWIMKCPSSIEITNLKGLTVPVEGKTKFKIDNQRYECSMDMYNHQNLTIITPIPSDNGNYKLQTFPCLGEIKLRNTFPKLSADESTHIVNKHSFIPLPDTKKRHPLFGIEYKPLIKLNKHVADNLQSANKKTKSKKKVKQEKCIEDLQSEIYKRKKRKRKSSSNEDIDDKLVRKKQKKDLSVIWNSEKAMEESLFANY